MVRTDRLRFKRFILTVLGLLCVSFGISYADLPSDYSNPALFSDSYKLSMIKVLDKDLPDFDKNRLDYVYHMTSEEEARMQGHYSSYVEPIRISSTASVIISTVENRVNILVNQSMGYEYLIYSVTFVQGGSSSGSGSGSRTAVIERENTVLSGLTAQEGDVTGQIISSLDQIIVEVRRYTSPAEAERAYQDIIQTLKHLGLLLDRVPDKSVIASRIANLTNAARNLVIQIDDKGKAADLTVLYINGMSQILPKLDAGTAPVMTLKTRLQGLAGEASDKAGTYSTEKGQLSLSGPVGTVAYDEADVLRHTDWAKGKHQTIAGALAQQLGYADPRRIGLTITLATERDDSITTLKSSISGSMLAALKGKGTEQLKVRLGESAVTVPAGLVTSAAGALRFDSVFSGAPDSGLPGGITVIPGTYAVDVALATDQGPLEGTGDPILLTLDLEQLQLTGYTDAELRKLGVYRLDEGTGKWTPVGGNYDPITRRIVVSRQHLSKYSILKTEKSFSDVQNSWAKDDINELLGKGVVQENALFSPKGDLTREEFARWIAKAYGLEAQEQTLPFTDVGKDHPYYKELAAAYSQGLIKGRSATAFDPKGRITRQEMATLISSALIKYQKARADSALIVKLDKYPDSKLVAGWAKSNVALVNELGIMQGDARGFRPTDYITREEAASVLKRIYN